MGLCWCRAPQVSCWDDTANPPLLLEGEEIAHVGKNSPRARGGSRLLPFCSQVRSRIDEILCNTLGDQRGGGLASSGDFCLRKRRRRRRRLPVSKAGSYFSREQKCCHGWRGWDPHFPSYCFILLLGLSLTLNQAALLRQRLCRSCTAQLSQRNMARSASMSRWVPFSYRNHGLLREQREAFVNSNTIWAV